MKASQNGISYLQSSIRVLLGDKYLQVGFFWEMFLGQFIYNVIIDIDSILLAWEAPSFQIIIRTLLLTLNK